MSPWIEAAPVTAAVTITSEPAGADVIVGEKHLGQTPTEVSLPEGDHRVKLVKGGYLENSRVVSVRPGQSNGLDVRLTPNRGIHKQVEGGSTAGKKEEGGGGGGSKWLFLGLGAAAVGGGAYYFLTRNAEPEPGTITVTPTGTGMAGVTSFTLRSDATDPDNDPLTFEWNFGDGTTGSGQSVTKVFSAAGTYSVTVTVKDKKHSVNAPAATVTVARSLAGSWTGGTHPGFGGTSFSYALNQSSTNITGSATYSGNLTGSTSVSGTVSGTTYPANVTITASYSVGGCNVSDRFSGATDASGSSMTGTLTASLTNGCIWTANNQPTISQSVTLRR